MPYLRTHFARRDFLKSGGLAVGAFALPSVLAARARGAESVPARQAIVVFLQGGPSHIDSFDPKPDAPTEYRGEFQPISTNVPGVMFAEHLPQLARRANQFNILRSVYHGNSGHEPAIHWTLTGYDYPGANVTTNNRNFRPAMGSLISKMLAPNHRGLPPYVCIPNRGQLGGRTQYASSAYLGMAYDPFESGMPPSTATDPFPAPPNLSLAQGVDLRRLEDRVKLSEDLDQLASALDRCEAMAGLDEFNRRAVELLAQDATRKAFDMSQEPEEFRRRYGNSNVAQRVVLARRLAEAGVNFTLVNLSNDQDWDTHVNNFKTLKEVRLPELDQAVSALLDDLEQRGLLETTLVAVFGEFGRTPKVNNTAGRDHWGNVFSVLITGGGLKRGEVIGASTPRGEEPHERPIHFSEVLATMYRQLGVPTDRAFNDHAGRPVPVLNGGGPIAELL